jgi:hypothetical protein
MITVKTTKADLIEEVLGLLILTTTSQATRDLMKESLHLVKFSEIINYRDSLIEDLAIAKDFRTLKNIEEEI